MVLESVHPVATFQAQNSLRALGSFEELLWQMDKRSPLHATLVAHVDGTTTVEQWQDALDQARHRHPLWSTVIAGTEDHAPTFQTTPDAHVAFGVIEGDFTNGWEREVERELSACIDAANGPLVRAVLLHTEASCMLILSAHHLICDGMSLAFAIKDVLQAIGGEELSRLSLHRSQEDSLGMGYQPRASTRDQEQGSVQQATPSVFRQRSPSLPQVRSVQFSTALTDVLRKRARQENTTLHAALVAAAGIAARQNPAYAPDRDLHLCSTISNRTLLGSPEDSGVFFTACDFPLAVHPATDLWSLARALKETLRSAQSESGVQAVLGAVGGIVRSGLDDASADEAGAGCSTSMCMCRTSALFPSQRLTARLRCGKSGVRACLSALKESRPWVPQPSTAGCACSIPATVLYRISWQQSRASSARRAPHETNRETSISRLVVGTSEICFWVSKVASAPSPTAYLAITLCNAIFGPGDSRS